MEIKDILIKNRPNLTASTIKTYISLLNNIYKKVNLKGDLNIDFFIKNYIPILNYLNNENLNSRKTILAAIVSLLGSHDIVNIYRDRMMNDIEVKKNIDEDQLMNDKQKENILDQEEIKSVYNYYYNKYKSLPVKKNIFDKLNKEDYFNYQSFILLSLISGIYIPPRRLLDFTNLKFNDDLTNNYYKKGTLYFRNYKTNHIYGEQKIKLPLKLDTLIKQYIKYRSINDYNSQYFFINQSNNEMSTSYMNQYINIIFGNVLKKKINIGINGLRHSFITDKYDNIPSIKEMNYMAEGMGHSINQALLYIKK